MPETCILQLYNHCLGGDFKVPDNNLFRDKTFASFMRSTDTDVASTSDATDASTVVVVLTEEVSPCTLRTPAAHAFRILFVGVCSSFIGDMLMLESWNPLLSDILLDFTLLVLSMLDSLQDPVSAISNSVKPELAIAAVSKAATCSSRAEQPALLNSFAVKNAKKV